MPYKCHWLYSKLDHLYQEFIIIYRGEYPTLIYPCAYRKIMMQQQGFVVCDVNSCLYIAHSCLHIAHYSFNCGIEFSWTDFIHNDIIKMKWPRYLGSSVKFVWAIIGWKILNDHILPRKKISSSNPQVWFQDITINAYKWNSGDF